MPLDLDPAALRELQLDYLATTRETLGLIRKHTGSLGSRKLFKSSFPVLLYLSHQLKGSGGTLGFPEVSDVARRMNVELNQFLEEFEPRPSPQQIATSLSALAGEMEEKIERAEKTLKSER